MSWVRRTEDEGIGHLCKPPVEERFITLPPPPPPPTWKGKWNPPEPTRASMGFWPAGKFGDLWRCDECDYLWRVGNSCDACDPMKPRGLCIRGGIYHSPGTEWRRATLWQRFRHRRRN